MFPPKPQNISASAARLLGCLRKGLVRKGQVRTGQVRTGQARTVWSRQENYGKSSQVRTGQLKTGQVKTGQVRTSLVREGLCNTRKDPKSFQANQQYFGHKILWTKNFIGSKEFRIQN